MPVARRDFIKLAIGGLGFVAMAPIAKMAKAFASESIEKLALSNDVWKTRLTAAQYNILREEGTEHPFTSALLDEHREGAFACVGCDLPLFESKTKFDSGTGWPSFYDAMPGHLETKTDHTIGMARTEYHCVRCGGHHGHVFNDGPKPTGLRYCSNGAVLKFIPKGA